MLSLCWIKEREIRLASKLKDSQQCNIWRGTNEPCQNHLTPLRCCGINNRLNGNQFSLLSIYCIERYRYVYLLYIQYAVYMFNNFFFFFFAFRVSRKKSRGGKIGKKKRCKGHVARHVSDMAASTRRYPSFRLNVHTHVQHFGGGVYIQWEKEGKIKSAFWCAYIRFHEAQRNLTGGVLV